MRETIGVRALEPSCSCRSPSSSRCSRLPSSTAAPCGSVTTRTAATRRRYGRSIPTTLPTSTVVSTSSATVIVRQAVRVFAVERIRSLDVLRSTFAMPATFDAKEYLEGAWGILRGDLVTVRVLFSKAVARYISERLWHPDQRLRHLEDGRLEVALRVADTLEVRRWILGYGDTRRSWGRPLLQEALRAEAEALVDRLAPSRRPLAATPSAGRRPAAGADRVRGCHRKENLADHRWERFV